MGVLVDWPGEATHPRRFIFLASESRPPACAAETLAIEQAARRREELNGLYVALTRTQTTLVISSTEPHIQNEGSWWQRLQDHATPMPLTAWKEEGMAQAPSVPDAGPPSLPSFSLKIVPNLPQAFAEYAQAATNNIANDTPDSRIGQAMHRLLEWVMARQTDLDGNQDQDVWTTSQLNHVARDFMLDGTQLQSACGMATSILRGDAAWCWDASRLAWQGNEVALNHGGRSLRIDRLVQHAPSGEWWVLDYKSASAPERQPELVAQLAGYRAAVSRPIPGRRCAQHS
jgi:ATP-dependent helicase/nuclease subunit A